MVLIILSTQYFRPQICSGLRRYSIWNSSRALCFYSFWRTKYLYVMLICTPLQCALYINIPKTRVCEFNAYSAGQFDQKHSKCLAFCHLQDTFVHESCIDSCTCTQNVLAQMICIFPELSLLVYFLYLCKYKFVIYSVYFIFDYQTERAIKVFFIKHGFDTHIIILYISTRLFLIYVGNSKGTCYTVNIYCTGLCLFAMLHLR